MTQAHKEINQERSSIEDAELIPALQKISDATDVLEACLAIKQYTLSLNSELLYLIICDKDYLVNTAPVYSGYPEYFNQIIIDLRQIGGCPFIKEATRLLRPINSTAVDRSRYASTLEKRFFMEIEKLDHDHIAVIPVVYGRGVLIASIGFYNQPFSGQLHERVCGAFPHIAVTWLSRFPEIKALFEKKVLTEFERDLVQMLCDGFSLSEICKEVGLSAHTVDLIISQTAGKLGAVNREQLSLRALVLGEISHPGIGNAPA